MKKQIIIIRGTKSRLQVAFAAFDRRIGVLKQTIYPIKGRYRLMVAGTLTEDQIAAILNDSSLKIYEHESH